MLDFPEKIYSEKLKSFISDLLTYNPDDRPSFDKIAKYEIFDEIGDILE